VTAAALLFDLDGCLVDSLASIRACWELLASLRERGVGLGIATSKSIEVAEPVLEALERAGADVLLRAPADVLSLI
jgi:phosphoglycolate phosphatase-like HAD superfamily hydrolase